MAADNISDAQVLRAYKKAKDLGPDIYPYDILMQETGETFKNCYEAMERADDRGLLNYGVSLRCGWVTEEGEELLAKEKE